MLVRVAGNWRRIAAAGNPEAYVRRSLVNEHISWWRRQRRNLTVAGAARQSRDPGDESVSRIVLWQALSRLTPRQRAVLVLRFYEDRSVHETAGLARRRRAVALSASSALGVTAVLTIITAVLAGVLPGAGGQVATSAEAVLPASGVSPAAYASFDWCGEGPKEGKMPDLSGRDCLQWRVVTRSGDSYNMPEAMSVVPGEHEGPYMLVAAPVAITADGRKIAYYSVKDGRFAVRDLESGQVRLAPPLFSTADIVKNGAEITLSPDGRFLAVGDATNPVDAQTDTLVDIETGETTVLPAGWQVRSIGAGGGPLVAYGPDRLGLLTDGEMRPFTDTAWHTPGWPTSDGTTVAYLTRPAREEASPGETEIVTVDAGTSETRTRTRLQRPPGDFFPLRMGPWLNATEVTAVVATPRSPGPGDQKPSRLWRTYAIDVTTGTIRTLDTYSYPGWLGDLVLPGF
ncbi:sigma factor-like helix-turn-helix DNA-binding protein [Herbidospora mongoliensis]|uniref:sigma factor-like helix-turn-helix DNA-binding protein n=1 Tax=Herbidospora mongoliensis TaxID=688067 RepID=UPI00083368F4|nr:sigma factor-like helix-turn-helix DNA-binding protein [Herbidospora mongoliensis]